MSERQYAIHIGDDGKFETNEVTSNDALQNLLTPEDIDAFFESLEGQKGLVLHFHGGLVSEEQGVQGAADLAGSLGGSAHSNVYFIWKTGLIETLQKNLDTINKTKLFQTLNKTLWKVLQERLGLRGEHGGGALENLEGIDTDSITEENLEKDFEDALAYDDELRKILREEVLEVRQPADGLLDDRFVEKARESETLEGFLEIGYIISALARIAYRVVSRYGNHRAHGLRGSIVEELLREIYVADAGEWTWGKMKQSAKDMWNANSEGPEPQFVGRYFLQKLFEHKRNHPSFKLIAIGHSAGSIAICHMLDVIASDYASFEADEASHVFEFDLIVFMAPACRLTLFDKHIRPEKHFQNFKMFTMDDDLEQNNEVMNLNGQKVPVFPNSLLYLISGILEKPEEKQLDVEGDVAIAGMHRFFAATAMPTEQSYPVAKDIFEHSIVKTTHNYLEQEERLILSHRDGVSGEGELQSTATQHGDFHTDPTTLTSLVALISMYMS